MFDLNCNKCGKVIGQVSIKDESKVHRCSACAEEERLLYVLPKGQICDHTNITDKKLEEIIKKVNLIPDNKLKEFNFGERIEKIKNKLKI